MQNHRHVSNLVQVRRPSRPDAPQAPARIRSADKREVWVHQFVQLFGDEAWIPLAIGCVAAHAKSDETFNKHFDLQPLQYLRSDPQAIVDQYENPSVLAGC